MVTTSADIEYFRVENRHGRIAAELRHALSRILDDIDSRDFDGEISMASYAAAREALNKAQP